MKNKKRKFKIGPDIIYGCLSLSQMVSLESVDDISHSSDLRTGWCVDYDPETDTCYSFHASSGSDEYEFEV